ncbi:MAG TPA: bacteriohopanetetrol glucosamine biosynthesis glycosyltransferase HpnI [Caulobacteraceae bacterium]
MSLSLLLTAAGWAVFALAACGAAYACVATWTLWRFVARPARAPRLCRAVSVLKPLHGDEPELYENLASFCDQDYGGEVQLILGARDANDGALAVARRLQQAYPGRDIVVATHPAVHGANRKISNLINMLALARGETIVISDSDVRIPRDGLSRMVAALEAPAVGLIYCLYRGRAAGNIWSRLAAMDVDIRYAPSVTVGEVMGANPVLGPTMALRRETLELIGGLAPLADVLADDFELGRAVRAAGLAIASPPLVIDHVFPERTAREMLIHELRWARTNRLIEPAGYLGTVVTHVLPLAVIGAALCGFSDTSLALLAGLAGLRLVQAAAFSLLISDGWGRPWLVPLRDVISFGVFLAAIVGDRVVWRGRRLIVARSGVILTASA